MLTYRIGRLGWKLAYKLGVRMSYRYEIVYDVDCKRYIGISPDIKGLVAEGDTVDEVKAVMEGDAPEVVAYMVWDNPDMARCKTTLVPQGSLGEGLIHG